MRRHRCPTSRFRNRLPFYADATENGITFHKRTQEEFDLELIFAEKAGIDYFAYCYYRGAPMTDDSQTETADNGTERLTRIERSAQAS